MAIAWYIVPYKRDHSPGGPGVAVRYCEIDDYREQIRAEGGNRAITEVLGNRGIVKVRASNATIAMLDSKFKRLPKDHLDDSLIDLPLNIKTALKNELLNMGYNLSEIRERFGEDLGLYTLRDVLRFATKRRLKLHYYPETDTFVPDGIVQECTPVEDVDNQVR